jgi:hypothetical protein
MKELLTDREVEETYNLNRRSLQRWRVDGTGIRFIKANGKILYAVEDIVSFLGERKHMSTSEYPTRKKRQSKWGLNARLEWTEKKAN